MMDSKTVETAPDLIRTSPTFVPWAKPRSLTIRGKEGVQIQYDFELASYDFELGSQDVLTSIHRKVPFHASTELGLVITTEDYQLSDVRIRAPSRMKSTVRIFLAAGRLFTRDVKITLARFLPTT